MAKKNKMSLPKRVAGVRIPKVVRALSKDVLSNPMGRSIVADALVEAAASILRRQSRRGSMARQVIEHPVDSARAAGSAGVDAASAVSTAATGTASVIARTLEGLLAYIHSRTPEQIAQPKLRGKKRAKIQKRAARRRGENGRLAEHRATH